MRIEFRERFTSKTFEKILVDWNEALAASGNEEIIFDLTQIEWVAIEELTFLFGAIRHIINKFNGRKLEILLPELGKSTPRQKRRLISLWNRWKIYDQVELVASAPGIYKWDKFFNITTTFSTQVENAIKADKLQTTQDPHWHKVIPFYALNIDRTVGLSNIKEILRNDIESVFALEKSIKELLKAESAYDVFENKSLSRIISTELYLNTLHHAFDETETGNNHHLCYMAIVLSNEHKLEAEVYRQSLKGTAITNKQASQNIEKLLQRNLKERADEEQEFFLTPDKKNARNESFIEFSFLDFGKGIANTLKQKFESECKEDSVKKQLSEVNPLNIDSKILEFAFLYDSSKDPFEEKIEKQGYVPRGLFYVIETVRMYGGMLIARSNFGKIVYDFSNEFKKDIKDCVRFSNEKLNHFQGTLISIIIPAKAVKINAYRTKTYASQVPLSVPAKYISLANLYSKAIYFAKKDEERGSRKNKLTLERNYLFKELNSQLKELSQEPCGIFIDFAGCDGQVVDAQLYYFLCHTPYISESAKAIILNPPDKKILLLVQQQMIQNEIADISVHRPIPCISSTDDEIIWIGINSKLNEEKLNETWKAEKAKPLSKNEFVDPDNLKGNVITVTEKEVRLDLAKFKNSKINAEKAKQAFLDELIFQFPSKEIAQLIEQSKKTKDYETD